MNQKFVNMYDLIFCITSTGDLINSAVVNHHKMVAYLAYRLAQFSGMNRQQQMKAYLSGLLHDIGAFSTEKRLELIEAETPDMHDHAYIGAHILEGFDPLAEAANIIRYHHVPWNNGQGQIFMGMEVPILSHILHLADRIAVLIDPGKDIISQIELISKNIRRKSGVLFKPAHVNSFLEICRQEYIWFDLTYEPLMSVIPDMIHFNTHELSLDEVIKISEIFAKIIDFRSHYTANHSFGVASVAEKMARLCGFSDNECKMMLVAGYLHDLGKLAIKKDILEKPGKLAAEEFNAIKSHTFYTYRTLQTISGFEIINRWASFHHERLDGSGYPFHLKSADLPLGSRIMAVADVFTAISEDRPYRKGMTKQEALQTISASVTDNKLCPYAFSILEENYDVLNTVRAQTQQKLNSTYGYINSIRISPAHTDNGTAAG